MSVSSTKRYLLLPIPLWAGLIPGLIYAFPAAPEHGRYDGESFGRLGGNRKFLPFEPVDAPNSS